MRDIARFGIALAGTAAVLALNAGTAAAHNELIGSTPEDGATVTEAPITVELEFDQPVQRDFNQVAVLDAGGGHHEEGDPQVVGARVSQAVADLASGEYEVTYRIVSADGHPITGSVTFTVTGPTGSATPSVPPAGETARPPADLDEHAGHDAAADTNVAAPADDDAGSGGLLAVVGGIAAAVAVGGAVYFTMGGRRPRARPHDAGAESGA
ncbi:MAG: copper resistance CopC family protein [Jiangellaceae bacterium]